MYHIKPLKWKRNGAGRYSSSGIVFLVDYLIYHYEDEKQWWYLHIYSDESNVYRYKSFKEAKEGATEHWKKTIKPALYKQTQEG